MSKRTMLIVVGVTVATVAVAGLVTVIVLGSTSTGDAPVDRVLPHLDPARAAEVRLLWTAGVVGILLDLVFKLVLSRPCGRRLAEAVDLDRVDAYKESPS